ncbi:MAG: outer membrane protein assembly factor BamA [Brevinema sp.]
MIKKYQVLALLFFATSLFAQQTRLITDIKFQGLKATSQNEALAAISLRPGDVFSEGQLNVALKDIYAMQRFQDVKLNVRDVNGGVEITFTVVEESLIDKIVFEGVSRIKAGKLRDIIDLKAGTSFREARARSSVFKIKEHYREEGNLEVEVAYRLEPIKQLPGQFDLIFEIKEGSKIVVRDINFYGVTVFKPKELESKMKTKKKMWIFRSGVLKEDEFIQDKDRIIMFYQENGYMDVKIPQFDWKIDDINTRNKNGEITKTIRGITMEITVEEGEKYSVGEFTFTGSTIFNNKELTKFLDLKQGEVYNKTKIDIIRQNIYKLYADRGYLFANISAIQTKRADNVIDTEFVIFEGSRAHIENIYVRGYTKTLPSVVRRYIQIKEGELYVNNKLEQSYNRLMQTQYFSNVRIEPSAGSADGLVNVDFVVTEQETGMIEFFLGYGTVSGFSGGMKLSEKNLFGRGWQISVRGEYGQYRQLGEIIFTEPSINNSPFSISLILGVFNTIYDDIPTDHNGDGFIDGTDFNWQKNPDELLNSFGSDYEYTRLSFRIGLAFGIQFAVYWNANFGYEINIFRDYKANFSTPLKYDGMWQIDKDLMDSIDFGWTVQSTLYSTVRFNNTDGGLWPTKGVNTALFLSFAGVGGDIHFINFTYNFDAYWNPFWLFTVAFHYDMALLFPQFGGKFVIRDANRLNFDGVYKMRGWLNYVNRGEASSYFSIETRLPVWSFIGLVGFWDYGAIFSSFDKFSWSQPDYIMSFGMGLAVNLPVLPIRLYVARPVEWKGTSFQLANDPSFWKGWEFVFSIQGLF